MSVFPLLQGRVALNCMPSGHLSIWRYFKGKKSVAIRHKRDILCTSIPELGRMGKPERGMLSMGPL